MLYDIEAVIGAKLHAKGEGGSGGGGVELPELTNPASADQILEGYEAIDGAGNKLTGTHVCESGGGGVGVAPMINHGADWAYCTFSVSTDTTVTAGGSVRISKPASLEVYASDGATGSPTGAGYGYIYGHPEITAHQDYTSKNGKHLASVWNSSATDFTLKAGETYTLVYLYNAE